MTKLSDKQHLYVRSMGKLLRVTAIFQNDDDANHYMSRNPGQGVVAVFGDTVLLADMHDSGTRVLS